MTAYSNLRRDPFTSAYSYRAMDTEYYTIVEFDELPSRYGCQVQDRPETDSVVVTENITGGAEFVQVSTAPLAGQCRIDYNAGYIFFNVADVGTSVAIDYDGAGTNANKENIQSMVNNEPRIEILEQAVLDTGGLVDDMVVAQADIVDNADDIAILKAYTETKYLTDVDSPFAITDNDGFGVFMCDTSGGNITITLPTLADNQKRPIEIIHQIGGNNLNADGEGAETIDGLTDIDLPKQHDRIKIIGTTSEWIIAEERISCQLRLDTYAGYGSVDTKIMRFTNSRENYGNMFSENHSTGYNGNQEGLEIIINKAGKYAFPYSSRFDTGGDAGLSLNSVQLTTGMHLIDTADVLAREGISAAGDAISVAWSGRLEVNDIVRIHTGGVANAGAPAKTNFTATYMGN